MNEFASCMWSFHSIQLGISLTIYSCDISDCRFIPCASTTTQCDILDIKTINNTLRFGLNSYLKVIPWYNYNHTTAHCIIDTCLSIVQVISLVLGTLCFTVYSLYMSIWINWIWHCAELNIVMKFEIILCVICHILFSLCKKQYSI